ncbi:MAG: carboxypeptidase-like regulatory domain-containing protein, partial [Bacteroidales bacterium]|nr:carboxypeptidase-like regulatory domain-containing protein [Bacteroidales bacterium]
MYIFSRFLSCVLCLFCISTVQSQSIRGKIVDENNQAVEYVSIYIKELKFGTVSDYNGIYSIPISKGAYTMKFQSMGYITQEHKVEVDTGVKVFDLTMQTHYFRIQEVVIGKSKKDY